MNVLNHITGNGGQFVLSNEIEEIGRLTYTIFTEENKLIISFVLIHKKFEGKGLGKYLIDEAIKYAKENKLRIYPHCSYARSVMNRMVNIDDIMIK